MNREAPIIGVDLDDVLWDLLKAWLDRYNDIADDNVLPTDIKSWDIAQYINNGTREMLFYILEQNDFWDTVKPIPESRVYLKELIDDGYDVNIVTASSYKILKPKMIRFYELFPFIKNRQVIVTERKQMIDLDVLIDDNPANLCDSSYTKVLFDAPHNQWCNEQEIGAVRLSNWKDVYEFIKEKFPIERSYIGR